MIIDPYLSRLLQIIIIFGSIILLLLLAIILIRLFTALITNKFRQRALLWEEIYLGYLQGDVGIDGTADLIGDNLDYYWFWRFLQPYLESLRGEDFAKTRLLCHVIGLIAFFRNQLKSKLSSRKALAARVLGSLHCSESAPELLKMLESENPTLILTASQGLAASGSPGVFLPVAKTLLKNTHFTYEGVTAVLTAFGRDICEPIILMLNDFAHDQTAVNLQDTGKTDAAESPNLSVLKAIMVDLLGHFRYRESLSVLAKISIQADDELLVHILKAFVQMKKLPNEFDIRPYLEHPNWTIRNFAAQAARLTNKPELLGILEKMLDDAHWWVRFNAADALLGKGKSGRSLLQKTAASSAGNAAGISKYILDSGRIR